MNITRKDLLSTFLICCLEFIFVHFVAKYSFTSNAVAQKILAHFSGLSGLRCDLNGRYWAVGDI
jgi:hypothetical protein